jgi:hypothetical protein
MNIFEYASACEQNFEGFLMEVGKTRKTTFFSDLSLVEVYGVDAVKDTYSRVMNEWGNNLEFMCEWVISLNQKIWQHHEYGQKELVEVYDKLWRKCDDLCREHFEGEELRYYYDYID